MTTLESLLQELPEELLPEVEDFVAFLLAKHGRRPQAPEKRTYLQQDWAGGLSHLRDQYTALQLQKMTLEWRGD